MAFHHSIEHSPQSSRVVPSGHEHNRSELMLVAPWRKHLTFTFGSSVGSGDFYNIRHAKRRQLANLPCGRILVREPPADELVVFSTRRIGKNRNARRDAALHEVRRFERPRAAGIKRYDDDVSGRDRFVDDERPSCGSQNRLPNGEQQRWQTRPMRSPLVSRPTSAAGSSCSGSSPNFTWAREAARTVGVEDTKFVGRMVRSKRLRHVAAGTPVTGADFRAEGGVKSGKCDSSLLC
jgi:hypothetical protein